MQNDLQQNYPDLDIHILGMNEWGQEVGNADATNGKQIPWLQDVDANQDDESDVWMNSWPVDYRDVAIVDATNVMVDQYNLSTYDLSEPANYATLKQKLIDLVQSESIPSSWTNPDEPLDVNDDTFISSIDALLVINELNSVAGPRQLTPPAAGRVPPPFIDSSHDGYVTSIDALLVLNHLNAQSAATVAARPVAASPMTDAADASDSAAGPFRSDGGPCGCAGRRSVARYLADSRPSTESVDSRPLAALGACQTLVHLAGTAAAGDRAQRAGLPPSTLRISGLPGPSASVRQAAGRSESGDVECLAKAG